jgi:hypothetical protein
MPTRMGSTMRNWSRWSDPDASKRSKVPEHSSIASPAGPSVPSVIEGLSTVEVRWILPGQLDAAVAGWFGRFPAGLDSREDIYLIHPVLRELSVKIRAIRASRSSRSVPDQDALFGWYRGSPASDLKWCTCISWRRHQNHDGSRRSTAGGHECRRSSAYTVCRRHFTPAG